MPSFLRLSVAVAALVLVPPAARAEAPHESRPAMTIWQAAVLGVVEGITEYLPVSSTGHLILAQRLMGIGRTSDTKDAANAYAVCIQMGAILAVAGIFLRRLWQIARGLAGRDPEGLRLGGQVFVAFLPAAAVGLLFEAAIKRHLFGLWPVIAAWLVGGLAILVVDRLVVRPRQLDGRGLSLPAMTFKMALFIGLAQCLAIWPGTSRSLATILGGLLAGLSLNAAVEFSFLLGLVTLSASTLVDALEHGRTMVALYGWVAPGVGLATAALSAFAAVEWMIAYLHRHPLAVFGYYRILLAVVAFLWIL